MIRITFLLYVCTLFAGFGLAHADESTAPDELAVLNQQYADYALTHRGDAERGKLVFENQQKAACAKCHSVDGTHQGVGPDLVAVGSKFDRAGLIKSILQPSAAIAIGYGTTTVITVDGKVHQGVLQRVTDDVLELKDNESKVVRVSADDVEEQTESAQSLMPDGLGRLISSAEFADLVSFLESKRQQRLAQSEQPGDVRDIPRAAVGADLGVMFDGAEFTHPVALEPLPGRPGEFIVLEQGGRVFWLDEAVPTARRLILNLAETVRVGGATGLLGAAFHPRFSDTSLVFLKYQLITDGHIVTIVEERRWESTLDGAALVSPRVLLRIPAVTQDHNGGSIAFGPDGMLYIGMGDSGPQRDPQGHGQDLSTLLGKILRIDVDSRDAELPYGIPADNPFRDRNGARPEVWAYGFREPWRLSFDRATKELWVGDVGQDRYEEVGIVRRGEDHGWNIFEGFSAFSEQFRSSFNAGVPAECVPPVLSYPRSLGVSVTGGYVYRGSRAAQLQGWYIFGDFESRRIWALQQTDRQYVTSLEIGRLPTRLVSFTEDTAGELCCVSYDEGKLY
ncbi:MAG: PQQ-dependent sugar dehydrogenase, partial [Planctomycetales bacterium]|nr:PQQ-dependent sugar dehydrogenase [Planctomycetales bacterium]